MSDAAKPIYVRIADSQTVFGIGKTTIYGMAKRKQITIRKMDKASLLRVAEVEAAI